MRTSINNLPLIISSSILFALSTFLDSKVIDSLLLDILYPISFLCVFFSLVLYAKNRKLVNDGKVDIKMLKLLTIIIPIIILLCALFLALYSYLSHNVESFLFALENEKYNFIKALLMALIGSIALFFLQNKNKGDKGGRQGDGSVVSE